jgi:hypoxanthine-DNA glycosylase
MKKSLAPIITSSSRILILGTMPGEASLARQQYYANPKNQFWDILSRMYEKVIGSSYGERLAFLHQKHLALWDVLDSCERTGSLDSTITAAVPNDVQGLLESYPAVRYVVLNGSKAKQLFTRCIWNGLRPSVRQRVHLIGLPSTSPTPGKHVKTVEEKVQAWSVLRDVAG